MLEVLWKRNARKLRNLYLKRMLLTIPKYRKNLQSYNEYAGSRGTRSLTQGGGRTLHRAGKSICIVY